MTSGRLQKNGSSSGSRWRNRMLGAGGAGFGHAAAQEQRRGRHSSGKGPLNSTGPDCGHAAAQGPARVRAKADAVMTSGFRRTDVDHCAVRCCSAAA